MKRCPRCGRILENGSRFCAGCGATVSGGPGAGRAGGTFTSSDILKIFCLVAAAVYEMTAISGISYFSHYLISDRIWGFFAFAAGMWNVLILVLIALKCDRRYGKSMVCALAGGSIVRIILHIIKLVQLSRMYFYLITGLFDIFTIMVVIALTGVTCYLMNRDGMLDGGESWDQAIFNIPWALKQMLDLNSGKNSAGGRRVFNKATPVGKLRTILGEDLFLIFVCVYTLNLMFEIYSGFAWLNIIFNIFPVLVCTGLLLLCYSNNCTDHIDDGGFLLINITLSFRFYGMIALAVIIGIVLLIATIAIGAYMLIVDVIVAGIFFLVIYFWWTLKKTVTSMRNIARGTEYALYSSIYPVVILVIQVIDKVVRFIGTCIMQIMANGMIDTVNQYGDSTGEMINEMLQEIGLGYGDASGLTRMVTEPINTWIQNVFGFSRNPVIMLIGIAVPVFEIMLLLKIRSYKKQTL